MWKSVAVCCLLICIFSTGCGSTTNRTTAISKEAKDPLSLTPSGSDRVSDFMLKDVNGESVSLSDYLYKTVVVLSFWAPCCESGREKTVDCQKLFETYEENGLTVLAVTADEPEKRGEVRTFVKQRGIHIPVLFDVESEVFDQYNPERVLPYTLIIDRNGEIVWQHQGYAPGDRVLIESAVKEILAKQTTNKDN